MRLVVAKAVQHQLLVNQAQQTQAAAVVAAFGPILKVVTAAQV
jgi:hypothetical protein